MRRNKRDRPFGGKGTRKDVRARVAVHVAADRDAQEVQDGWRDVDDRTALLATRRDGSAIGQQEPIRRIYA